MDNALKSADSNCHKQHSSLDKKKGPAPSADAPGQQSFYNRSDHPVPDNSPFFEERSNSLSSKGN